MENKYLNVKYVSFALLSLVLLALLIFFGLRGLTPTPELGDNQLVLRLPAELTGGRALPPKVFSPCDDKCEVDRSANTKKLGTAVIEFYETERQVGSVYCCTATTVNGVKYQDGCHTFQGNVCPPDWYKK